MAKPEEKKAQEVKEVKEEVKPAEVKKTRYPQDYKFKSETKELGYIETTAMHNGVRIMINRSLPSEVVEDIYKAFDEVLAFHKL